MSLQTPADLARFVAAEPIRARLISDLGETPTVPAAAAALGVRAEQIIKTLLFNKHIRLIHCFCVCHGDGFFLIFRNDSEFGSSVVGLSFVCVV